MQSKIVRRARIPSKNAGFLFMLAIASRFSTECCAPIKASSQHVVDFLDIGVSECGMACEIVSFLIRSACVSAA